MTRDRAEISCAIETSHDQECLWGGACNRSDCRSNRRRNMKNGQGEDCKNPGSEQSRGKTANESVSSESISSSTNSNTASSSTASPSTPAKRLSSSASLAQPYHASTSLPKQNPSIGGKSSTLPKQSQVPPHTATTTVSGGESRASTSRSLFSSPRAHSSDSSFDDSPQSGCPLDAQLNKQVVSDTFRRVNSPSNRAQSETLAGSSSSAKGLVSSTRLPSGHRNLPGLQKTSASSSNIAERPGLFSEGNSAFGFTRQDSGFAGDSPSSATVLPSPTSSLNLSSPGKENFRSAAVAMAGLTQPVSSSTSRSVHQPHAPMEIERVDTQPDSTVATGSASPAPSSNNPRTCPEPQEAWVSGRKRTFDLPLEKIPSPNSKKGQCFYVLMRLTPSFKPLKKISKIVTVSDTFLYCEMFFFFISPLRVN